MPDNLERLRKAYEDFSRRDRDAVYATPEEALEAAGLSQVTRRGPAPGAAAGRP